jgi:poly [ADP-ribose] polymerase 10/14/15
MYFAVDASYSIDDTYSCPDSQGNKYMYLARVVVGDFCVGNDTMNVPPPHLETSCCMTRRLTGSISRR